MVFNRDLKHYENFTLMSHFVAQPAEMTHIQIYVDWFGSSVVGKQPQSWKKVLETLTHL